MNTPAHAVFNMLVLARRRRPELIWPVALGAVLPDLPMFLFYFWEKFVMSRPERWIWSIGYREVGWQTLFDLVNSLPLLGGAFLLCVGRKWHRGAALAGSMILHCLCDLPLHHHDAHRHFFPISDWRFQSPVSYWDPRYHGELLGSLELLMVLAGSVFLIVTWKSGPVRLLAASILLLHGLFILFAITVWG